MLIRLDAHLDIGSADAVELVELHRAQYVRMQRNFILPNRESFLLWGDGGCRRLVFRFEPLVGHDLFEAVA